MQENPDRLIIIGEWQIFVIFATIILKNAGISKRSIATIVQDITTCGSSKIINVLKLVQKEILMKDG